MSFCSFIGNKKAKLALILNLIDPRINGALFVGDKGSGKSTLARSIRGLMPPGAAFVEVPLNVTEEMLLGCIDIEKAVRTGSRVLERGLLSRAEGGMLYIDDVNLLPAEALSLVLNAQGEAGPASPKGGPRPGSRPSFVLIGTMNPEEGTVSSHALDRFGLCCSFESTAAKAARLRIAKRAAAEGAGRVRYARGKRS